MEPFPHPVHISPCQVVLPLEQQEPLVLEFEALPGGQILANALAQLLQRVVRHALDMESIDHDPGLWQRGAHHSPINVVHVQVAGHDLLHRIASTFARDPYEYRRGWPDLTVWKDGQLRFVEVKAPGDVLGKSQKTIAATFGAPLGLDFSLAAVVPA